MRKGIITLLLLLLCFDAVSQEYKILSVIGTVQCRQGSSYIPATRRMALSSNDNLKLGTNSAVSILNDKDKKVYSYGQSGEVKVMDIVTVKTSALKRYFDHFVSSLRSGDTDEINFEANVVYRAANSEDDIYYMLVNEHVPSDLLVTMSLVDSGGNEVDHEMHIGDHFVFRVRNHTTQPLFVNVLSVDADYLWFDCLPMDKGGTMSHLLIPAESTVDLSDYPMELTEPKGYNRFTLVAYDTPFDLRRIIQKHNDKQKVPIPQSKVGIYTKTIIIN